MMETHIIGYQYIVLMVHQDLIFLFRIWQNEYMPDLVYALGTGSTSMSIRLLEV